MSKERDPEEIIKKLGNKLHNLRKSYRELQGSHLELKKKYDLQSIYKYSSNLFSKHLDLFRENLKLKKELEELKKRKEKDNYFSWSVELKLALIALFIFLLYIISV